MGWEHISVSLQKRTPTWGELEHVRHLFAKPDEVYTQATVPGYWVVLDAAGQVLDYRATEQGAFRLCEGMALPGSRESR